MVLFVTIFRSILDRLIYNDENSTIDSNLSISNVGDRKGRNISDSIFILNAVMNSSKKVGPCPELKIHVEKMSDSSQEKYLGDMINTTGNAKATGADRISRGHGIVSEIRAILNEVPLGRYKLEMGLHLRQAMLINRLLFNSEAWHSVTQQDILSFEKLDKSLLRDHSKTPLEMLYLESGATPIRFVLASRRLSYLQIIMKRDDEELPKRVLKAQIESPLPGDFISW